MAPLGRLAEAAHGRATDTCKALHPPPAAAQTRTRAQDTHPLGVRTSTPRICIVHPHDEERLSEPGAAQFASTPKVSFRPVRWAWLANAFRQSVRQPRKRPAWGDRWQKDADSPRQTTQRAQSESSAQQGSRPRVLVLGGGFAGLGAAQKLKTPMSMSSWSTAPLSHVPATALPGGFGPARTLDRRASLRDLFDDQAKRVYTRTGDWRRSGAAGGAVREVAPISYDYLVLALGATSTSSARTAASSTPSRCTRWRTPCASRSTSCATGRLPIAIRRSWRTASSTSWSSAAGYRRRDGRRTRRALSRALREGFPGHPAGAGADRARGGGPELFTMFRRDIRSYTKKALEKRGVEVRLGEARVLDRPDAGHAQVGRGAEGTYAGLGRGPPGQPARHVARPRAAEGQPIAVGPDLSLPDHPEVFVVGDIAWITEARMATRCRSSARSRCSPASMRARRSSVASRARGASRSRIATRARWRR